MIILNRKIVGTAATGIPEDAHAFVEIHGKYEAVKLNLLSPEVSCIVCLFVCFYNAHIP